MSRTTNNIPLPARVATIVSGTVAIGVLALLLRGSDLYALPWAFVLGGLSVALAVGRARLNRYTTISLSEFPLLTGLLVLDPGMAALVAFLVGSIPRGPMGIFSRAGNIACFVLPISAAALFLQATTESLGAASPADAPLIWATIAIFAVAIHIGLHSLLHGVWSKLLFGYGVLDWLREVALPCMRYDPVTALLIVPLVEIGILLNGTARGLPLVLAAAAVMGLLFTMHATRRQIETSELKDDFFRAIFASLARLLEMKDPETAIHSARVALFSRDIARVLGLSEEEQSRIHLAGLLHDVGKVGVPDEILLKPGRLTAEERAIMERHARLSAEALQGIPGFDDLVRNVYAHHERLDGSGYPEGIAGDALPMGARILGVADTFEALTSDRPYRSGRSQLEALEVFEREMHLFDSNVVDALRSLVLSGDTGAIIGSISDFSHEWSHAARHLEVRLDEERFVLPPERPRHPFAITPSDTPVAPEASLDFMDEVDRRVAQVMAGESRA